MIIRKYISDDCEAITELFYNTVVAVENGRIVGFGDIDRSGYLNRLYVHKDFQRRDFSDKLCYG